MQQFLPKKKNKITQIIPEIEEM